MTMAMATAMGPQLAKRTLGGDVANIDMPITEAVCALLGGAASASAVVEQLLARPLRNEAV